MVDTDGLINIAGAAIVLGVAAKMIAGKGIKSGKLNTGHHHKKSKHHKLL